MSWEKTKVSEFLFERKGKYKPQDKEIQGLKRIEKIDFKGTFHIGSKSSNTNMILVKKGDLVISGINVAKGAMGIYSEKEDVVATIHYSSYTFDETKINVNYFKRFLKSPEFKKLINEQVKGGIKTEIKPKHILSLEINLPNINTQGEIVANFEKIENDMIELDSEVAHQQNLLSRVKQSILQEAIEGKLTKDWREINTTYHKNTITSFNTISNEEKLFDIPNTWTWLRLDDLVDNNRGITYGIVKMGKEPKNKGITALRCSDVKYRYINITNARQVSEEISQQYKRTILEGGEILLNIRGTLGGCAIVDDSLKGMNIAREVGLIPIKNKDYNLYILNVLTSKYFEKQIHNNLRGIAYKGLNLKILKNLVIPFPPIEEQKEIVNKIEKLFAICDELEEQINSSKQNTQTLIQAVLKEAFEN